MTNLAKQIETLETTIAAGETYASLCQPREQEKIEGILSMQRYKLKRLYMLKSLNIESQADLDFIQSRGISANHGTGEVIVRFPDGTTHRLKKEDV